MTPDVAVNNAVFKVAERRGIDPAAIFGRARKQEVVTARHIAIREAAKETGYGKRRLAKAFGLDHSTVHYALRHRGLSARRAAAISLRKQSAREFLDSPSQLRFLLNNAVVSLAHVGIIDRLHGLRLCEEQLSAIERRREPNARRVPAEQRIDDIDAAILAARYVRRFGNGH
ncbi:hypothetical protein CHELA1G11_11176 [Hyphomicrobiales bacterium]|nr:hypothetical protein CHELA1G11_11176 [Hyphomicrobiales bacterium]